MIIVNGITVFLTLHDSISMVTLNNYNNFIEDFPDDPAIYGVLVGGVIEVIRSKNTLVSEIQIAW